MKWYKSIIFILLSLACTNLVAQSLKGLQENQVIKKHLADHPYRLKSAEGVVISLPFFDDFSTSDVFPDQHLWADQYAFINNSFAIDPVSVGVATLDAIDEYGDVYAVSNFPISSDMLTSQSIDLSEYTFGEDTVRLSFFYQCGGKGEVPDLTDSLVVEFFSPLTNKWDLRWVALENEISAFRQVILTVDSVKYYQTGFRFRFRNVTSISVNDVEGGNGALSNADVWNIDYVMMNTNPVSSHRYINDFAITDVPRKMLDAYEIIPWAHLNAAQSITRNVMNFDIRNLGNTGDSTLIGRSYYVKYKNQIIPYIDQFENIPTDTIVHRVEPFLIPFTKDDNSREGTFEVYSYLIAQAQQYLENDTSRSVLNFKNSYAYDDGTPEYGFGIEGPSTNGALLAVRFRIFKSDTLRAIEMLFNKARGNFNFDQEFKICVWKDGNGKPGDLLYMSDTTYMPALEADILPGFTQYVVKSDEDIIITDSVVYVGWKQNTEEFLNIGYDVNRDNRSRTFVNTSGDWINLGASLVPGTVMIRATFGAKDVIVGIDDPPDTESDVFIYPNPVSQILYITSENIRINQVTLIDITGRIVYQRKGDNRQIDVSSFSPGMYQAIIYAERSKPLIRKIVVTR
jgi:hypothetical protein